MILYDNQFSNKLLNIQHALLTTILSILQFSLEQNSQVIEMKFTSDWDEIY